MIEELARRYNASKQAEETGVDASSPRRSIARSTCRFSPGLATSIINTVKGYPTAVSFFDSTGQPWPIQWDTNSNPAAIIGRHELQRADQCRRPLGGGDRLLRLHADQGQQRA